jgi:hypothetical protein
MKQITKKPTLELSLCTVVGDILCSVVHFSFDPISLGSMQIGQERFQWVKMNSNQKS